MRTPGSRGRRLALNAACAAAAAVAAVASVDRVSLLPPGLHGPRSLVVAAAATHAVVDGRTSTIARSTIGDVRTRTNDFDLLSDRTVLLGELMVSRTVRQDIARRAGIDPADITARTRITTNVQDVLTEPDSERRADQLLHATVPYRIEVQPHPTLPELDIYTQAPSVPEAERLADAAVQGTRDYLARLAASVGRGARDEVSIEQLGPAQGAVVNGPARKEIALFTFLVTFGILRGLIAALRLVARGFRRAGEPAGDEPPDGGGQPPAPDVAPAGPRGGGAILRPVWSRANGSGIAVAVTAPAPAAPWLAELPPPVSIARVRPDRRPRAAAGDWPRTTRVLPWLLALFLAVLWLVPFNVIQLTASLPIDLKFDRLLLPEIFAVWVLAVAAGGVSAPRLRLSLIHVAVGGLIAVACLSLALDARYLNQTLELDLGIKKLTLLLSYLSVFLMVASVIRPTEVRAFRTYFLILACICAAGTIWEYRFQYNIFYEWSAKLLPGMFTVGSPESAAVDEIGRRLVRGPAEIPLEMVAMLAMALPIGLVGILQSAERRTRLLHGFAVCLILAAMVSTYRKSAFMAPAAVIITLGFFLRRKLLRLAPLALVGLVAIHVLSPGAFGSIALQLNGNRLGVTTVSDRTSDYDAIRPDLWSHLAFGRGFGTYDHTSYRILDMELLHQLMEVGVVGLVAYIMVPVTILIVARRLIAGSDPDRAFTGLVAGSAAMAFLVVSCLFDVMSFPHCPYLLLFVAGMLVVAAGPPAPAPIAPPPESPWSS